MQHIFEKLLQISWILIFLDPDISAFIEFEIKRDFTEKPKSMQRNVTFKKHD